MPHPLPTRRLLRTRLLRRALASLVLGAAACHGGSLLAQVPTPGNQYQPINQMLPVGTAARWSTFQDPGGLPYVQPVQVVLPTTGKVTFLQGGPQGPMQHSPAQAGLMVGLTYRLKISDMPEFPGAELYPSVEVLDRLHPPPGREHEFPVPLDLTREEIEDALDGGLVTKVVYIEQPSLAVPVQQERPISPQLINVNTNLLAEADRVGRPMLLVRIGGRQPDPRTIEPGFYGTGGPVLPSIPPQRKPANGAAPPSATGAEPIEQMSGTQQAGFATLRNGEPKPHPKAPKKTGFRLGGWMSNSGNIRR